MNRSKHTRLYMQSSIFLLFCILLSGSCTDHLVAPPNYDLDVTLLGTGKASGFIKFRQVSENPFTIFLNTSIQGLEPNTNYALQRAVDTNLDGNCTSTAWLTLGKGLVAQNILTDNAGAGSAALFRDVSAFAPGTTFDIHFQIINLQTSAVVLTTNCYQYAMK